MRILWGFVIAGLLAAQTRVTGPEAGLAFQSPASGISNCQYGEIQRFPTGLPGPGFNGACAKYINFTNVWITHQRQDDVDFTLFPWTQSQKFFIRGTYNGAVYNLSQPSGLTASSSLVYGFNVADPNFLAYVFSDFLPNVIFPKIKAMTGKTVTATEPAYVSVDGYSTDYGFWGAKLADGTWTNKVTWLPEYPQSETSWGLAYAAMFTYAKVYQPLVRLAPHAGTMATPGWGMFRTIYADCPAMEREWFPITQLSGFDLYSRRQFYAQLTNLNWFANFAPPVFANDPPTRVLQWGAQVNNGDYHTALATYEMVKGANSFFDCAGPDASRACVPSTWLPTSNKLGVAGSTIQVLAIASGRQRTDGYNLFARVFPGGRAYLNMSGTTRTITLPAGAKDWAGNRIASITLSDGKGEVVVVTPAITGASLRGATSVTR